MARLTVKGTDTTLEVGAGDAVKVGRDASNEIPLPDEGKASRRHCQIMGVPSGNTVHYEVAPTSVSLCRCGSTKKRSPKAPLSNDCRQTLARYPLTWNRHRPAPPPGHPSVS